MPSAQATGLAGGPLPSPVSNTIAHGGGDGGLLVGGGAVVYRSPTCWPVSVSDAVLAERPTAGLWVPGSYACVWDVIETSLPDDSWRDFTDAVLQRWLVIGAGVINEHLGNRGWPVPLTAWSETVVWANCELCYIGAARKRGLNTEANAGDFQRREAKVEQWLKDAQNRLITPDPRPSDAGLGRQAIGYKGQIARGWDQPRATAWRRGY